MVWPLLKKHHSGFKVVVAVTGFLSSQRRLWLLLCFSFMLAACVRIPEPAAPSFSRQARSATVPLHLVHTGDHAVLPLVAVKMGKQTYWWLLDTGSSHNLIAEGLAKRLALRAVASGELATIGGRQQSTHYQLPKLK
ncbi:MAG: hypothetical protein CSA79_00485, partial [Thiothrix nivea]